MRQPRCNVNIGQELYTRAAAAAESLGITNRALVERAINQLLTSIFEPQATPSATSSSVIMPHDKTNFYALRDAGRRDMLVAMAATDAGGQDLLLACAVDPVTDTLRPLAAILECGVVDMFLGRES